MAGHRRLDGHARRAVALAVIGLVILAACGDDDDTGATPPDATRPDDDGQVVVVSDEIEFNVDTIIVGAGERFTIVHENRDVDVNQAHNVVVKGPDEPQRTQLEAVPVQELELVIDEPGEYEFTCDLHPTMAGTVIVES